MRFGCGALAGLFAGLELASRVGGAKFGTIMLVLLTVVGFGLGAAWLGDRFWRSIRWW